MEPPNLNSSDSAPDDARIEAFLRGAAPKLPDDGFSAGVLAALPPAKAPASSRWRTVWCGAGAVAGCGFALSRGVDFSGLQMELGHVGTALANAGLVSVAPWLAGALAMAVLSVLLAFHAELNEKFNS